MKKIQNLIGGLILLAVLTIMALMSSLSRAKFIEHEKETIKQVQDTTQNNNR